MASVETLSELRPCSESLLPTPSCKAVLVPNIMALTKMDFCAMDLGVRAPDSVLKKDLPRSYVSGVTLLWATAIEIILCCFRRGSGQATSLL